MSERGTGLGKRKPVTNGRQFKLSEMDGVSDAELRQRAADLNKSGLKAAARSVKGIIARRAKYRD